MSGNSSRYAKNLAQLSARIFGEQLPSTDKKSQNITRLLAKEPYYKKQEFAQYYPPVQDVRDFFSTIRYLGLYVDEHKDFKEGIEKLRRLRGKGKKSKREN